MTPGSTATDIFYVRYQGGVITPSVGPSCVVIRNGIDTTVAVSIASMADNAYRAQFAIPSNWGEGDAVHLRIQATHAGYSMSDTKLLGSVSKAPLLVQDLADLQGLTDGLPMTANDQTGVIQAGSKRIVVTENGTTKTYTRDDA